MSVLECVCVLCVSACLCFLHDPTDDSVCEFLSMCLKPAGCLCVLCVSMCVCVSHLDSLIVSL